LRQVKEHIPENETQTVDLLYALNRSRYAQFVVGFRNDLLDDLDTIDKVQERVETFVTLAKSDGKLTSQIFLCSEILT
jgi:hypothetical protein